ncbi:MAG TPA: ABC transporter permease, partial [Rhodocyclaceae bacterium]
MKLADMQIGSVNLRRLWALCRKESAQIVRDPSSILIAFVLPVILLLIFGFGINLDANTVRIAVVVEDTGAEAHRFAQTLEGSRYFDVVRDGSRVHAKTLLEAGDVRGMVVIASDFSAKVRQGQGAAAIQVLTDGAEPNTASFLGSYLQGAWQTWLGARSADQGLPQPPLIDLSPRYWFNPSTSSRNFLLPGSNSVIITIIGAMLTSLVVAREWERGTMESVLSTPVTRMELLLSKILPYYVLGICAMTLCVLMTTAVIGVPYRGSLLALFVVGSLFLGSGLGLGLLLSTTMRNQLMAAQA